MAIGCPRQPVPGRWRRVAGHDIDDHSRFCVVAQLALRGTARAACLAFIGALRTYGAPEDGLTVFCQEVGDRAARRMLRPAPRRSLRPAVGWPPGDADDNVAAATTSGWRICGRPTAPGPISVPCSPASPTSSCSRGRVAGLGSPNELYHQLRGLICKLRRVRGREEEDWELGGRAGRSPLRSGRRARTGPGRNGSNDGGR